MADFRSEKGAMPEKSLFISALPILHHRTAKRSTHKQAVCRPGAQGLGFARVASANLPSGGSHINTRRPASLSAWAQAVCRPGV